MGRARTSSSQGDEEEPEECAPAEHEHSEIRAETDEVIPAM